MRSRCKGCTFQRHPFTSTTAIRSLQEVNPAFLVQGEKQTLAKQGENGKKEKNDVY